MNFQKNRERFFNEMPDQSVAIIPSGNVKQRSNDTYYPFRQDSNFYYLTGFLEDSAMLVMQKVDGHKKTTIFVHPKDPLKEMWEGRRVGVEKIRDIIACDESLSIDDYDTNIMDKIKGCQTLYAPTALIKGSLSDKIEKAKEGKSAHLYPDTFKDINALLFALRRKKQPFEIAFIKQALEITQKAHHAAMAKANPSKYEYDIMALVEYIFKTGGASGDAYTTIVAGGNNANILHYTDNGHKLLDGELILMDAGSEYKLYASDITRCFPVNGKFSTPQKELYEIVLKTQKAAIERIKPGVLRSYISDQAIQMLSQGLKDIKVLDQSLDEIIEKELYKPYYPHGIGHWMGLDVHDPVAYKDAHDKEFAFEEGDVLTIEPGLYLDAGDETIPEIYKGIGIRIEDNILVTKEGCENLSSDIAKEIHEVEDRCQMDLYDYI